MVIMFSVAQAQSDALVLAHMNEAVELDGPSFEAAWEPVESWPAFQFVPNNGSPATEHTEFLVGYDEHYLYLALRAYDSDPDGIRTNTLYRDRLNGDDHFEILIDTFNDNETAVLFSTTPAGIRKDSAISNDASGGGITSGSWINADYNTFWDVATKVTDQGWFAEIRIPFSSLHFQDTDGLVQMGIILQRKIARKTERVVFPAVPPIADYAFLKPSLAQKILLKNIHASKPIYITPYLMGGVNRIALTDESVPPALYDTHRKSDTGVDAKYNLSRRITLDVTANTDFAQVEADDKQVNLTRFSLFFPEKRQFFQERESLFEFRMGQYTRLFHSRRIGLTDDGQPIRILGGARMVGRIGLWDFGLMDMQTEQTQNLAGENFGVLRMRRQIFNDYSYAGFMTTSRLSKNGDYNYAYGLDSVVRLFGDDYLTVRFAQTLDNQQSLDHATDALFVTGQWERRRRDGWGYRTIMAAMGPDYNPGIGFTQRSDFYHFDQALQYSWIPGELSGFIYHTLSANGLFYMRNQDKSLESAQMEAEWKFSRKAGQYGGLVANVFHENLLESFILSHSANVPAGYYVFGQFGGSYYMTHTAQKQIGGSFSLGSFYDGWKYSFGLVPKWYVSKHLELSSEYSYVNINFGSRNQNFHSHIARLRIRAALDTKLSANTFIQFDSVHHTLSANIRFRYKVAEGNDFWLVYNNDLGNFDPLSRLNSFAKNRTMLIKYTHTMKY